MMASKTIHLHSPLSSTGSQLRMRRTISSSSWHVIDLNKCRLLIVRKLTLFKVTSFSAVLCVRTLFNHIEPFIFLISYHIALLFSTEIRFFHYPFRSDCLLHIIIMLYLSVWIKLCPQNVWWVRLDYFEFVFLRL